MMDASKTLHGAFGKMIHDGEWMTNVTKAEANVEIGKEDVPIAGSRWLGSKSTTLKGTGTMTGFKMTNKLLRKIASIADDTKGAFITELIMVIDDPEAREHGQRVRLKGVQFDTIPLLNYEHGAIVEEETPFTFSKFEFLD
ncbi:phage tail tube protein [Bacillus sp. JJ722]|uniref:phage tail tube protein n=1 Tax=Bacillus sp. JJ722 TaxID=3122973 RepID=UPI002FFE0F8F